MKSIVFMIVLLLFTEARAESPESAREQLEAFSEGLLNVQLEFSQVVTSQDGSVQDRAGGQAWLQRPDRMRWVYQGDFPEIIVADGRNVWIYDEALQQVTVKQQSDRIADAPLLILTDLSQLDQQFQVAELGIYEDMNLLELRSNDAESEFERLLVGVDDDGIRMMIMEDAFGQRTEIQFSNVVRNADIEPGIFSFTPPEDADVVGEVIPAG